MNATSALKPTGATAKAGLATGEPHADRSTVVSSSPFTSYQRVAVQSSSHHESQRGLSSHPVSQGCTTVTSPSAVLARASSRKRTPASARSTTSAGTDTPRRRSSATTCPYIGGWVIDEVPERPQNPANPYGSAT